MKEDFLKKKLDERESAGALRTLKVVEGMIDFCSNDYLGLANLPGENYLELKAGSTGSRLLAGNFKLIEDVEKEIAAFHDASSGLIFNSGYDANLGLLSAVPQKADTILYDSLSHASIRDGVRLSFAQSFAFQHNDLIDLEKKLQRATGQIFVVTESVFSMDGDKAPLVEMAVLCEQYGAALIVDEAHATGVIGNRGEGLVQLLGLQSRCFARVHTFGKALGCHGAIVLGSESLRSYLINFARSFVYTTALPPTAIATIRSAYKRMSTMQEQRTALLGLIELFQSSSTRFEKITSETPIQAIIIPGNDKVKEMAISLQSHGFDIRPILYPTVPLNRERLRIVLHSFNTKKEVQDLLHLLS
jgi:8-amino-7-oxononanoate synthase